MIIIKDIVTSDKEQQISTTCESTMSSTRQKLRDLILLPRAVKPLPENKRMKKGKINLEKQTQIETSLKEMEEQLKASDIGQLLLRGGLLVVPVADYIKDKYKLKSVETIERLEEELVSMHQDLINMGVAEEEIIDAIAHEKKKQKESTSNPKDA